MQDHFKISTLATLFLAIFRAKKGFFLWRTLLQ